MNISLKLYWPAGMFLALLVGVGCVNKEGDQQHDARKPAVGAVAARVCAERVLREDSASSGASGTKARISMMRSISMSGCSTTFHLAYLSHIHVWEDYSALEREMEDYVSARKKAGGMTGTIVDALGRGLAGDTFGGLRKLYRLDREANLLKAKAEDVQSRMRSTFKTVELLAVSGL